MFSYIKKILRLDKKSSLPKGVGSNPTPTQPTKPNQTKKREKHHPPNKEITNPHQHHGLHYGNEDQDFFPSKPRYTDPFAGFNLNGNEKTFRPFNTEANPTRNVDNTLRHSKNKPPAHNMNTEYGIESFMLGENSRIRVTKPHTVHAVYEPRPLTPSQSKGKNSKKEPTEPTDPPPTRPARPSKAKLELFSKIHAESYVGGSYLKTKKRNLYNRKKHTHKKHMF